MPPPGAIQACARAIGPSQRYYTTSETAADIDALRKAFGVSKLTTRRRLVRDVRRRSATHWPIRSTSHGSCSTRSCPSKAPTPPTSRPCRRPRGCCAPRAPSSTAVLTRRAMSPRSSAPSMTGPELLELRVGRRERRLSDVHRRARRAARGRRRRRSTPDAVLRGRAPRRRGARRRAQPGPSPEHAVRRARAAVEPGVVLDYCAKPDEHHLRAVARLTAADLYSPWDRATALGNGLGGGLRAVARDDARRRCPPANPSGDLPRVPVLLLLRASHDLSTPLAWARDEAAKTRDGRLVIVPAAGHSVRLRKVERGRPRGAGAVPGRLTVLPVARPVWTGGSWPH